MQYFYLLTLLTCCCLSATSAQSSINECASDPCLNGATCDDGRGSYTCRCADGWEGIDCQVNIDECHLIHGCIHGQCVDTVGSYRCDCDRGYHGNRCQHSIDECVDHSCVHGKCVDGANEYVCACDDGYSGKYCENQITMSVDSGLKIGAFLLLVLGLGLVLMLAACWAIVVLAPSSRAAAAVETPRVNVVAQSDRELPMLPINAQGSQSSRYESMLKPTMPTTIHVD